MRSAAAHRERGQGSAAAPAGALHRELIALARYGVLLRAGVGEQVMYRANPDHPLLLPELTGLIRKTAGVVDVLRDALAPLDDRIEDALAQSLVQLCRHAS